MALQSWLFVVVVVCFSMVHLLEMCAFVARYSGISSGAKAFGFTLNRSVMMLTRFFTMMLMPVLGFVVDIRVNNTFFLGVISCSLAGATLLSCWVYWKQSVWKKVFVDVAERYRRGESFLKNIMFSPILYFHFAKQKPKEKHRKMIIEAIMRDNVSKYVLQSAAIVYAIYSLSVFLAFYAALNFYEYRSAIGQLSAVTNAFATVLLTFYVEPKMASRMDKSIYLSFKDNNAIMLGRIIGVGIVSQIALIPLWLIA